MSNIIKSFITGTIMSLSRINHLKDRESYLDDIDNDITQEQQVRKQEIKLLSEKRFYDILDRSDNILRNKNSERTEKMLESRGITENFLSFKNHRYDPPLHEQLSGNVEPTYKFKTDNDICKYVSDVHIKNDGNKLTLNFLINLEQQQFFRRKVPSLKNLTALAINENAKIYAYDIIAFDGIITPTPHEIFLVFEAKCVINGEYVRDLSNENRTTHKDDLIDPKTYKI
jgi:hypothetical protein